MSSKPAHQLDINVIAKEDPLSRGIADGNWPSVRYADSPQAMRDHGSPWRISPQWAPRSGGSSSMQSCVEHAMAGIE